MICYHHNDLDGRTAAAVVAYYTNNYNPQDYVESDYSGLDTTLCGNDEEVIIVDYSFTESTLPQLLELIDKSLLVTWIDHHDSSIDLLKNHPELSKQPNLNTLISKDHSGCMLAYQYFFSSPPEDEIPLFIRLISDYDNWDHKNPGCVEFFNGMNFQDASPTSEIYKSLFSDWNDYLEVASECDAYPLPEFKDISISHMYNEDFLLDMEVIWKQGYLLTAYQDDQNRLLRESIGFESRLDGIKCYCINAKGNSLMFGDRLMGYPICVAFHFDGTYYNYSVYSDEDGISCKEIAEAHGGGGHKGAAGFRSKELLV